MICLSTDKAVYPINAMGMSKAMMEKLMVAKARTSNRGDTVICATRYGNVMASRGSVIPLFVDQIRAGRAADRHRPEHDPLHDDRSTTSVDLVLHAFAWPSRRRLRAEGAATRSAR